ncbi:MAG: carboxynorspermidine decarboxylase [Elusimicrobiota bacterium]
MKTPYYFIDENKLMYNLLKIEKLRKLSGTKSVLALKCFSTWSVFNLMRKYMDGTTSSSLYEARLGHEKFGKEVHAYSVAWKDNEISEVKKYASKVIFNSISQLNRFYREVRTLPLGLRVNPGISYSHFDLANPVRKYSRLGVCSINDVERVLPKISGLMFHYNCENNDYKNICQNLSFIADKYGKILKKLDWVSLGGGYYFTQKGFPLEKFAHKLKEFSTTFGVQVYLEPGESSITQSAELVTTVVDIVRNKKSVAIVDASTEAHMLDLLIYRIPAKMEYGISKTGKHRYIVAGRSCLAGDIFGEYSFKSPLRIGSELRITDAAGYTMVKKNWFNGLQMPSIVVKRLNGKLDIIKSFSYNDFKDSLS